MRIMEKRISLLIPCYNAAAFLPGLLAQAREQSTPFAEIICYDDASQDSSAAIAREFGVTIIRGRTTRGPGFARNRLLEASTAPWVHFHDADDALHPEFVEKMSSALSTPDHGAACSLQIVWEDKSEKDRVLRFPEVAETDNLVALMIHKFIHLDALVLPRHLLIACGAFVNQMRFSEDRDMLARLAETAIRFCYVDEPLATWVKHSKSLTRSRTNLQQSPYRRWYLHRCFRKLSPRHRITIGDQALYMAWILYYDARGTEAEAYRKEARWWFYLARLCNLRHQSTASPGEKLMARLFGLEFVFFLRRTYSAIRAKIGSPNREALRP
jgi:glycosyltransferase involved in cell wall biosynthesis